MNLSDLFGAAAVAISGGTFVLVAKYMGRCEHKFHQLDAVTEEVYTQVQSTIVQESQPAQAQLSPGKAQRHIGHKGNVKYGLPSPKDAQRNVRERQQRHHRAASQDVRQYNSPTPSAELFQGQYDGEKIYFHER